MIFHELFRIVWINLMENKFKVILTSLGIVVGAATIVMVIAVGRGGQMDVADQFKNLNAGAIDISFTSDMESSKGNSSSGGNMPSGGMPSGGIPSGGMPSGNMGGGSSSFRQMPSMDGESSGGMGNFPSLDGFIIGGGSAIDEMINKENVTLTEEDVEDIQVFVPDIDAVSISFSTKTTVTGGELEEETTYTVAGVKDTYEHISNLTMEIGEFITESNDENKEKVCVLGYTLAIEIFGNTIDAYDSTIYIDGRPYVVNGILQQMGSVSSGISPDESIFIPYSTGIKYITGTNVSPTITVIAEDVNNVETVITNIETVLAETYPNTEFTISDAGSKMEAASSSADTLTLLLVSMAGIVFVVGGIGIMNVLFVSVKERTQEIGILKAIGSSKKDILMEFLVEANLISTFGGILGISISFAIMPVMTYFGVRVEPSVTGGVIALIFAVITGTVFGFYPALKASNLVPVEALNGK